MQGDMVSREDLELELQEIEAHAPGQIEGVCARVEGFSGPRKPKGVRERLDRTSGAGPKIPQNRSAR
jgi:hypothetical protein